MKPLVAIVGRPNVGKSTLFNRLIGQRKAIVLDTPGVTRDRHYGEGDWAGIAYTVIDTGGFEPLADGILASMRAQAMMAIREADVVICVLDGRDGLLPADREVVQLLRQAQHKTVFAVNKIDGARQEGLVADFYSLGLKHAYPVSAEHGRGVGDMLDTVLTLLPPPSDEPEIALDDLETTRIALVGRPNVGKSTLTNRLLGEDRMIVDSVAGTTRDAIDSPLTVRGKDYLLIDTAGLRRPRGVKRHTSEGFSVLRTLRAMDRCHVAILMIDAEEGATDQDARIAGDCHERGRGLIIAVNKWDAIEKTDKTARDVVDAIRRKLPFCTYAPVIHISGLTGQRVHKLLSLVDKVREGHRFRVGTGELNRWLERTLFKHQPAVTRGRRLRMYYATQARVAPPTIVISCNEPLGVHFSYKRYLINQFRETFSVEGTPIRLIFRGKKNNPYAEVEE